MPRPDWLRCETCLWFEDTEEDDMFACHKESGMPQYFSKFKYKTLNLKDCFCSHWTCANCFGSYDAWDRRDYETDEEIYVDHAKCKVARFGI